MKKVYMKSSKLNEILARLNISDGEFADKIGVQQAYVSMLRKPRVYNRGVSPKMRKAIMDVLGVEFDDIFSTSKRN